MTANDVTKVVQQMEHAPTISDGHTHNFDSAYQAIVQMQQNDGGSNTAQFRQDMASLNDQLRAKHLITNLEIDGVDNNHHLITKDMADNRTVVQDASRVNDFGALGSGQNGGEMQAALLAKAFGINVTRNANGSYDVQNPLDDPQAASNILGTILNGLTGAGRGADASGNQPPLGMNGWMWQAWNGWPEPQQPQQPEPPDDQ